MASQRDDITTKFNRRLSQSQRARETEKQFFMQITTEAGIVLNSDNIPNILTQEQSLVIRELGKLISEQSNVRKFLSGLKAFCKKETDFRKALIPTNLQKGTDDSSECTMKIQQESLIQLFLNIGCLQSDIIDLILEEITRHASEDSADTSFLRLLLNALSYLPFIKEPKVLTEKLLDILEISTLASQLEILNAIPEIIPDCHYDDAAKELTKLLDNNANLTGAIIDCLNSLNLSADSRMDVQEFILDRLLNQSSLKIFCILYEFVTTDCKSQKLLAVLLKCRDALDAIMKNNSTDKEVISNKVMIFHKLGVTASVQKNLYEGWLNVINSVRANSEHKPIDLLLLFMLHSSRSTRKKGVESVFKKRIKSGLFKVAQLEAVLQNYIVPQILHDYLPSIIEITSSLLQNNDVALREFTMAAYKLTFMNAHVDHIQRQDILHSLILLTGSGTIKNVGTVLNILNQLSIDKTMQRHTLQVMGLLEKLDTYELKDVKQLFELLCGLTIGPNADETVSGLRDELHMLIRKQLSSTKKAIKQKGIVSAIVMVKHIARAPDDQSELSLGDESLMNISDLPRGAPQDAAGLLELTNTCTSGIPELVGLYYDQLSTIANVDNLDKYFAAWLSDMMMQDFQDAFVLETIPEPINDIQLSSMYSLNKEEEVDTMININIAGLAMKVSYTNNNITILAPFFRLLRLLTHNRHEGDLASIDALLGCGVIMPTVDDIDAFDIHQIKQIADCTFYCINWFREVINAFVTQKSKNLRLKVIERLQKLVELEEQLNKYMDNVPEHKLPTSYFHNMSHTSTSSSKGSPKKPDKVARPRKKLKTSDTVNETLASTAATQTKQKGTAKKVAREMKYTFREIDTDIILLLKYRLKIDEAEEFNEDQQTQQTTLDIHSVQFILRDLNVKLYTLTQDKDVGLSHLSIVDLSDLIKDCIKLLPSINRHFQVITANIQKLLVVTDGCLDHVQLSTPWACDLKKTFGLILECLSLIFSWSGFQHSKNLVLLKDCLKAMRPEGQSQLHSANQLIKEFANSLYEYIDCCMYLQCAVHLVKTMEALFVINMNPDMKKKIAATSAKLLARKWYNLNGDIDKGKAALENIDVLVKAYLNSANVKTICGLVATLQTQASELKTKDDCLPMLVTIDKTSFHIFYRCLCNSLLEQVKNEVTSLTNNEHLVLWRMTALTMQGLMIVVKAQETRSNLTIFLKKSVGVLKVFLTHGIPIMEIMLRSKTDQVVDILKTLQTSTRFLHHLCCFSKLTKDATLMAYVPQFRLTLETFVFRVKAALVANNCSGAFWMGNLKNRDLHGEDILTQSSVASDDTVHGNSDEELPVDDSDDDDVVDEPMEVGDGSASQVYD